MLIPDQRGATIGRMAPIGGVQTHGIDVSERLLATTPFDLSAAVHSSTLAASPPTPKTTRFAIFMNETIVMLVSSASSHQPAA